MKGYNVVTQTPSEIVEFIAYVRDASRRLSAARKPTSEWKSEDGLIVTGWEIERGDFPSLEDVKVGRDPIYMGGSWGRWSQILGDDGFIYRYQFHGRDEWNGEEIVTSLSNMVVKQTLASLRGKEKEGEPFAKVRRKIDALVGTLYEW